MYRQVPKCETSNQYWINVDPTIIQHWFDVQCFCSANFPTNTIRSTKVGSMRAQRLRRWSSIEPTLVGCIVFAGSGLLYLVLMGTHSDTQMLITRIYGCTLYTCIVVFVDCVDHPAVLWTQQARYWTKIRGLTGEPGYWLTAESTNRQYVQTGSYRDRERLALDVDPTRVSDRNTVWTLLRVLVSEAFWKLLYQFSDCSELLSYFFI